MALDRPNFYRDSPSECVCKLFNIIQSCRVDVTIMMGRPEEYKIDSDTIKIAEALVRELKSMV